MTGKTFSSQSNAKLAIKRQGLQNVPHRIERRFATTGTKYLPVFMPELFEDYEEIRSRGFEADNPAHKKKPSEPETSYERHSPINFDKTSQ